MQDHGIGPFERIERALDRIEAQLDAAPPAAPASDELDQLRNAHQRLRGRVEEAIVAIDRMLEEG